MANGRRALADGKRRPSCIAGADPAADRAARPALSVCAAQARAARLHGAEGGRDGRVAAAAGADAPHPGQARQSRAHARQRDRGRRAMRRAVDSRDRRADDVCPRARRPQARPPAGVLRRGGRREGPGGRARRRARGAERDAAADDVERRRRAAAAGAADRSRRAASPRRSARRCSSRPIRAAVARSPHPARRHRGGRGAGADPGGAGDWR